MKHSGIWAIRQGRSSIYVAPSKFEKEDKQEGKSNSEIERLIEGRRILEVKPIWRYANDLPRTEIRGA